MPIPQAGESRSKFISRCMKFPDLQGKAQQQRLGECFGLWRGKHKDGVKPGASRKACSAQCRCDGCTAGLASLVATTYKLATADQLGLIAIAPATNAICNDSEMSAFGVLSSNNRDRQGDVIEPDGVDFSQHILNPIVLWDHGRTWGFPIGKTEDAKGHYTVYKHLDQGIITAKTFFIQRGGKTKAQDQAARMSLQVYGLIQGRFVRAMSIAVKDIDVERLNPDPDYGWFKPGKHILKSILCECTWTPLPANPDAVASLLGRGRICGEIIDPLIVKSFTPWLPPRRAWATGMTLKSLSGALHMPDVTNQDATATTPASTTAPAALATTLKDDMGADAGADQQMSDMPHGAQCMHQMHNASEACKSIYKDMAPGLEPEVKEELDQLLEMFDAISKKIRELHSSRYPDLDGPEGDEGDGADDSDNDDDDAAPSETTKSDPPAAPAAPAAAAAPIPAATATTPAVVAPEAPKPAAPKRNTFTTNKSLDRVLGEDEPLFRSAMRTLEELSVAD